MCDYSLEHVASRPAVVADRLVTVTFHNTITRGFAAADDVNTAVCLRPGTELAFERPVEFEHPVTHMRVQLAANMARGGIPITTIASTLRCSRHTVYKALAQTGTHATL